jgi:hypothetical protein
MAQITTISAPVKGWNTTASISEIPPNQAIVLDNLIPSTGSVTSRKGYSEYATGVGTGNVDSLFELKALGVNKMVAAADGGLYDTTTIGAATLLASGYSSNQWQGAVFNAVLGLVNVEDLPQTYDGTSVAAMTVSGSGLTVTNLSSLHVFKNRTYFTENAKQGFWYSALSAMGGVLTFFPLGKVGNFGGNLVAIQTLTKDGGAGQDDAICFFMSSGEIIIYEGTDPATDFVLTGVFKAGRPIGPRSIIKLGPDIMFVTNEGYLTVSSLLPLSFGKDNGKINEFIKGAASTAVAANPLGFGWQVVVSPSNNILVVNVPGSDGTIVQHVLNVNTMAWCRFTGISARCWATYGNDLYFGGTNGTVYLYGPEYTDDGTAVTSIYQGPYLSFNRGGQCRTTAFRPRVRIDGDLTMTVRSSIDFKPFSLPYTVSYSFLGASWGDIWGSPWATTNTVINYLNLNSVSYDISVSLTFTCGGLVDFFETNYLSLPASRI